MLQRLSNSVLAIALCLLISARAAQALASAYPPKMIPGPIGMPRRMALTPILITLLAVWVCILPGRAASAAAAAECLVDEGPFERSIAPPIKALSFAQISEDGRVTTLLVVGEAGESLRAIDLSRLTQMYPDDVFDVLNRVGRQRLIELSIEFAGTAEEFQMKDMLPAGGTETRHIATGANFQEHAEEVAVSEVFGFSKFGRPTGPVGTLSLRDGVLLDYEVELCVRFDRDIRTVADFDEATKGFFLCGDFTDRAKMLRLLNPWNVESGIGFSDAKSGPGFFPTGPYLVVPRSGAWRDFVGTERIMTKVNGELRQDALGCAMTLDFRRLVEKTLNTGNVERWVYGGREVALIEDKVIPRGSILMSGTPAGVIFRQPDTGTKARVIFAYFLEGGVLSGKGPIAWIMEDIIFDAMASGGYLARGDDVSYASSRMGKIAVTVE